VAIADAALGADEANALFGGLADLRGLILAVSGGPDSTALLVVAAAWARRIKSEQKRPPNSSLSPSIMGFVANLAVRPRR